MLEKFASPQCHSCFKVVFLWCQLFPYMYYALKESCIFCKVISLKMSICFHFYSSFLLPLLIVFEKYDTFHIKTHLHSFHNYSDEYV